MATGILSILVILAISGRAILQGRRQMSDFETGACCANFVVLLASLFEIVFRHL